MDAEFITDRHYEGQVVEAIRAGLRVEPKPDAMAELPSSHEPNRSKLDLFLRNKG